MSIYLGNLTVKDIQEKAGVNFPPETIAFMEESHQDSASDIKHGKWHCFDIPFVLVCGDRDLATKIHTHLKGLNFIKPMQIGLYK